MTMIYLFTIPINTPTKHIVTDTLTHFKIPLHGPV